MIYRGQEDLLLHFMGYYGERLSLLLTTTLFLIQ